MRKNVIEIVKVRSVTGTDSLASAFGPELRNMELEDLLEPTLSTELILQKLQNFFHHSAIIKNVKGTFTSYLFLEMNINLGTHILMRKGRMIASGTEFGMRYEFLRKIQGEFPGKFDKMAVEEVDNEVIKSFCTIHYKSPDTFRIIQVNTEDNA